MTGRGLTSRQVFWAVELMQVLALSFVKLSCMFFYRRVFRAGGSKLFDIAMFTIVAIIIIWTISFFFAFLFMCGTNFDYLWTSLANEAKCAKTMMLQNGYAISDVITDFLVLLFPMPLVRKSLSSQSNVRLANDWSDMATANVCGPESGCHWDFASWSLVSIDEAVCTKRT